MGIYFSLNPFKSIWNNSQIELAEHYSNNTPVGHERVNKIATQHLSISSPSANARQQTPSITWNFKELSDHLLQKIRGRRSKNLDPNLTMQLLKQIQNVPFRKALVILRNKKMEVALINALLHKNPDNSVNADELLQFKRNLFHAAKKAKMVDTQTFNLYLKIAFEAAISSPFLDAGWTKEVERVYDLAVRLKHTDEYTTALMLNFALMGVVRDRENGIDWLKLGQKIYVEALNNGQMNYLCIDYYLVLIYRSLDLDPENLDPLLTEAKLVYEEAIARQIYSANTPSIYGAIINFCQ